MSINVWNVVCKIPQSEFRFYLLEIILSKAPPPWIWLVCALNISSRNCGWNIWFRWRSWKIFHLIKKVVYVRTAKGINLIQLNTKMFVSRYWFAKCEVSCNAFNWMPVVLYQMCFVYTLKSKCPPTDREFGTRSILFKCVSNAYNTKSAFTQSTYFRCNGWHLHVSKQLGLARIRCFEYISHFFLHILEVAFAMIECSRKIIALLVRDIEI